MEQYKKLLSDILSEGVWKEPARENMPRTKSLFGTRMEFDMADGFPLLTTKKMYHKAIIVELLWFLKGDTNIKYLVDNGCNIWNKDAYGWYLKHLKKCTYHTEPMSLDDFIYAIKKTNCDQRWFEAGEYKLGDLGKVYGCQWKNQNGVDQIKYVVDNLKNNPMSRYSIIDTWNPADFSEMALPPCHLLYQFNCREISESAKQNTLWLKHGLDLRRSQVNEFASKYNIPKHTLDLQMYQRSCDTFLGVPFNIASASLLLHIMAKAVNMIPGKFVWVGGDTHIYENHLGQVESQLSRDVKDLPSLKINKDISSLEDIENLTPNDFSIENYVSHPTIKAELKTGL